MITIFFRKHVRLTVKWSLSIHSRDSAELWRSFLSRRSVNLWNMSPAGVLWKQEEGLQQKVTWASVNTTDTKLKDPTEVGSDMLSIKETFLLWG